MPKLTKRAVDAAEIREREYFIWDEDCQIAANSYPLFASKNDPSDRAETGDAEPHIAEQSRSWRSASGEREVMRDS